MARSPGAVILPFVSSPGVETELKIPVAEHAAVRRAIEEQGGQLQHPSAREVNILLDADDGRLQATGCVLRLRRFGSHDLITFKGRPSYDGGVKTRVEHELEVADLDRMQVVLEALGFRVTTRYEKDREVWTVDEHTVVLDHTPMGDFVEIEGPPSRLAHLARSLGLDPRRAVHGSYIELWQDYRTQHSGDDLPTDMVFES